MENDTYISYLLGYNKAKEEIRNQVCELCRHCKVDGEYLICTEPKELLGCFPEGLPANVNKLFGCNQWTPII